MSDSTLETLLDCWARWCVGGWRPSRCQSAEGQYRPERVADDESRKPAALQPFSLQELERVERAVCRMPRPYADLLRLVWVGHRHPSVAARRAGLKPHHINAWPEHKQAAFALLRRELVA